MYSWNWGGHCMGLILRLAPRLFWLLAAAARGEPVKEYSRAVNQTVGGRPAGQCPAGLPITGSDPGGGGALVALPLSNNTIVRGHAREGRNDLAVPGSTIFFGM